MADYGFPDNPSLTTSSRLHAWWLQQVCGYHVIRVRHHLHTGWFGHIRYNATFLMTPGRVH
ncbi:MAG: hypothetical protein KAH38_08800 [Candidatus Hydrogenedentes bacterium]|nr:hypothetical protein [Candidatus Hydrogenedentota bacterium]